MFKTISENSYAEIVEKKSRFIANVFYIETVEEASNKIKDIEKKYFDAKHNCYAYSVYKKDGVVNKFSDDGEPSGTAGAPMLKLLVSQNISNCLVVVTRYFGGILLGTGGLVRVYTESASQALENAKKVNKDLGLIALLEVSYSDLEKCKYYLKQNKINISNIDYKENVVLEIEILQEKYDQILKQKNEFNFQIIELKKIREQYILV